MSSPMARSSFSTAAFAQLARRLRHTNTRYAQIAHQFRCRIRPTHHAKRRAYRAGLRIDVSKARALPAKQVIAHTPSVLVPPTTADTPANLRATVGTAARSKGHGDAYMRGLPLRNLPEIVGRKRRRRDGRQRIMLRLPPLKFSLDYGCGAPFQGPVPGAPRLLPRQLPDDESGVEEMSLESSSLVMDDPESSTTETQFDVRVYSGLCITIPPRGVKRKLQDTYDDGATTPSQHPKRILVARWNESQKQ